MTRINFDLPEAFLKKYDEVIEKLGFETRGQALRAAMREQMKEAKKI